MSRNKFDARGTAQRFINRYGIKKTVLAKELNIGREELYAFLEPDKYPHINLQDEKRARLEEFAKRVAPLLAA